MTQARQRSGSDLFIVDNSDKNWKATHYLHEWADLAHSFDVATGYFEIGALLALDGQWQKLDKLRILMGDEVSKRTKDALLKGVKSVLDESIERAKEKNDFLSGVPAIVDAIRDRQIECKVYAKKKFHAKAYITHARHEVLGSMALVGSSNFTVPGLTDNVELNIQVRHDVEILQRWYEDHWDDAEDISPELLKVIERHTREYSPFEVYAKALQEYFRGHELTVGDWEKNQSAMYWKLDQYQREGYQALMKIARQHRGAFLCDGVGLGKTFVGMMLIERLVEFERKRVVLFTPKAARGPVWEKSIKRYLPQFGSVFSNLAIFNHTELQAVSKAEDLERVREMADAVMIDEAHHFRNPGVKGTGTKKASRYWQLYDLLEGKDLFLLTATPINNRLMDLRHMIELFSRQREDYFKAAPLGIQNLRGHFIGMEKQLDRVAVGEQPNGAGAETNQVEAEEVLSSDDLFRALVVQRSRAYVKRSQEQQGDQVALFPKKALPQVAKYSIKKTYGGLLETIEKAFNKDKPLFSLAIYYPLAYYKGPKEDIDTFQEGRQKQVVGLIRTLFLKRFESSARAFELSCQTLLKKLLAFATTNSQTSSEKSTASEPRRPERHRMLFSLRDLPGGFGPAVERWLEKREVLGPVYRLYLGTVYNPQAFMEQRFLNLVQALEVYHRRNMATSDVPEADHERRKEEILDAVPGRHKEWLEDRLVYSNEPSLSRRLKEIIRRYPMSAYPIAGDNSRQRDSFVFKVVTTRNYRTHFNQDLEDRAVRDPKELHEISQKLRNLLEVCLLGEIGFEDAQIRDLLARWSSRVT